MENLGNIFAVGIGGFIGSVIRYLTYTYYYNHEIKFLKNDNFEKSFIYNFILEIVYHIPLATLFVNVIGSLIIGGLLSYYQYVQFENENIKLFMTTGLMGGLTTFSTFSFESFELIKNGDINFAILYVFLSLVLGILSCFLGYWLSNVIFH